jgi:NAD(P)-dependent dehydrogenase (short-subunit alcohol dehydrogenase family)
MQCHSRDVTPRAVDPTYQLVRRGDQERRRHAYHVADLDPNKMPDRRGGGKTHGAADLIVIKAGAVRRVPNGGMTGPLLRAIPFRRFAKPQEIADAILFFAGPRSDYITGQVLSVSGGLTFAG